MKTISKILSIVLCLAMVMALFVVGASAANTTLTVSSLTGLNSNDAFVSATAGNYTFTAAGNGAQYTPVYKGDHVRIYTDNSLTITAASGSTIGQITFTTTGGKNLTSDGATVTNGGVVGDNVITFATPVTSCVITFVKQVRFKTIEIAPVVDSCNHEGTGRVSVKDANKHWNTCQECGAIVGEKAAHSFTNGVCSCGVIENVAPVAGTTYKAGTFQATLGKTIYVTGAIKNDRFLATTETRADGVDVTVEAATGGFYLSFMDGTAKKYIDLKVTDSAQGYVNVVIADAPGVVYTFDATHKTFVAKLTTEKYGEDTYFIGANGTYDTLGSSYDGNLATYFPLYLYAIETTGGSGNEGTGNEGTGNEGTGNEGTGNEGTGNEGTGNEGGNTQTPVAPKPFVPSTGVDTPVAGTAFKLGLYQKNVEKYLYFNNTTPSADRPYYQGTTDKFAEAVDVFAEAVEGGYKLYFMDGTTKTYIDIYQNGTYVNLRLTTEPTAVFTWNTEHKTFVTKIGEDEYYIGTYDKFETISACKLSKIADSFASHLYAKEPAKTADNSVISVAVAAAVLSIMGAAVLVSKKKEF